jgi:coenzyme F420 hydrogenase subunit beta
MQCLGIIPAHLVKYTIGLFCIENFSFDDVAREMLEKKLDINLDEIVKLNIKDDFIITLTKDVTIHVPLEEVHEVARPACFTCRDFSNQYADISVGGLGSPDGHTTVLIRTNVGTSVYDGALRKGYIRERTFEDTEERRIEKTKMLARIVSFARRKKRRSEERLSALARGENFGGKV